MFLSKWLFPKIDLKRLVSHVLPFAMFFLCFVRYLISDNPPNRPFPNTFRPEVCENCFRSDFRRLREPPAALCAAGGPVDVVVLITTVPSARESRAAVRDTWGRNGNQSAGKTARFVFLFGAGYSGGDQAVVDGEWAAHGDVLQTDFLDNYYNLSLKVMAGFKWVIRSCPQAAFVARSADDNYVNVPSLLDLLGRRGAQLQRVMFGSCEHYALPWRWPFHKWAISVKEYPGVLFPPYCIGTTFVTSLQMTRDLVAVSPHVPFFPIEDVYFGMCIKLLARTRRPRKVQAYGTLTVAGFNLAPPSGGGGGGGRSLKSGQCPYPDPMITVHPLSPPHIRRLWRLCMPGS